MNQLLLTNQKPEVKSGVVEVNFDILQEIPEAQLDVYTRECEWLDVGLKLTS